MAMKYRLYELLRCFLTGILKKTPSYPRENAARKTTIVETRGTLSQSQICAVESSSHLRWEKSNLPPGNLTVCHGKIHPFLIGKPSMSMGHLYHGYVSHNQRVLETILIPISCGSPFFVGSIPMIRC